MGGTTIRIVLGTDRPLGSLSPRELEVLAMTADGLTNTGIADRLGVTIHGVKFHLAAIYRKLGVANRTEAAALYVRTMSAPGGGGEAS